MTRTNLVVTAVALSALASMGAAQETVPESGVIGGPPPIDITMEVRAGATGEPTLSQDEFVLSLGGYYRFNFVCPDEDLSDETGFNLEVVDLLANAHLRVVSVGDIEIYMQGMSFRAIQCDEAGSARFSFHPMRTGVYPIYVSDHSDPAQEAFGRFVVE